MNLAPTSQRQLLRDFATNPYLRTLRFGDHTAGELAQAQPVFEFRGPGRVHEQQFVPITDAAVQLTTTPQWKTEESMFRRMFAVDDARRGMQLTSMGLADSLDGSKFNFAVMQVAVDPRERALASKAATGDSSALRQLDVLMHDDDHAEPSPFGGQYNGSRFDLRYGLWQAFQRTAAGTPDESGTDHPADVEMMAHVVAHELAHAITPAVGMNDGDPLTWIEEGTAELLALRSRAREFAEAFGQSYDASRDFVGNDEAFPDAIDRLVELAGVDTTTRDVQQRIVDACPGAWDDSTPLMPAINAIAQLVRARATR